MKNAIKKLKFYRKRQIARSLGKILASNMPDIDVDIIVPVPLSRKRFSERGFNQSELIAKEYCDIFNKPLINDVLIRTRETLPQFGLKRMDRLLNVRGAFKIKNNTVIRNKSILLVDDILTTGFTANECSRTLKEAKAKSVFVAVLSKA